MEDAEYVSDLVVGVVDREVLLREEVGCDLKVAFGQRTWRSMSLIKHNERAILEVLEVAQATRVEQVLLR